MTIHVENNFDEYIKKLTTTALAAAEEIKITELAEMQLNTPVKTSSLQKSETGLVRLEGTNIKVTWGSSLVYAKKVEFEDKSYIRSTLKREMGTINKILNKHLKEKLG